MLGDVEDDEEADEGEAEVEEDPGGDAFPGFPGKQFRRWYMLNSVFANCTAASPLIYLCSQ